MTREADLAYIYRIYPTLSLIWTSVSCHSSYQAGPNIFNLSVKQFIPFFLNCVS